MVGKLVRDACSKQENSLITPRHSKGCKHAVHQANCCFNASHHTHVHAHTAVTLMRKTHTMMQSSSPCTLLSHCTYAAVTLQLHSCHTAATQLSHCCYTAVTLLPSAATLLLLLSHTHHAAVLLPMHCCCYTAPRLLSHCCYSAVTPLSHCHPHAP
jgi:hypothetical protein